MVMVKKSAGKKQKINKLWIALGVLLVIQIATVVQMMNFQKRYELESSTSFRRFVNEVETKRYTAPIIDVSENKVYLPEERLVMPLTSTSRKLLYNLSEWPGGKTDLFLSISGVVGNQVGDDDPSCDRMVRVSMEKDGAGNEKLVGQITPTKHGLRYIYQNTSHCGIYPVGASQQLVALAKSLRQY
jgi:hypothetical protein